MIEQEIGIHPEVVAWTLSQLDDQERADFSAEVKPILQQMLRLDAASAPGELVRLGESLAAHLEAWRISLAMHADPDWRDQVEAAGKAWAAGEGELTTVSDIRASLSV